MTGKTQSELQGPQAPQPPQAPEAHPNTVTDAELQSLAGGSEPMPLLNLHPSAKANFTRLVKEGLADGSIESYDETTMTILYRPHRTPYEEIPRS